MGAGLLVLTCTGVSFAHGSNDGQKGQGLLMLILIGVLPGTYALQMKSSPQTIQAVVASSQQAADSLGQEIPWRDRSNEDADKILSGYIKSDGQFTTRPSPPSPQRPRRCHDKLNGKQSFGDIAIDQRRAVRTDLYLASGAGQAGQAGQVHRPEGKGQRAAVRRAGRQVDEIHPRLGEGGGRRARWVSGR